MSIGSVAVGAVNVAGSIGGIAQGAGNLAGLLGGTTGWNPRLLRASYGDIPFAVEATRSAVGRRYAIHEYPFRDGAWVEDLGQMPKRWEIFGYLVEDSVIYHGGPVIGQRDQLLGLVDTQGARTLIHPTFGIVPDVVCVALEFSEERESGRVIAVRFAFMKAGLRLYPSSQVSTQDLIPALAAKTGLAALADFVAHVATTIVQGAAVVQQAVATAVGWYQFAVTAINDVKAIIGAVSSLSGNFGRLFSGANNGFAGGTNPKAAPQTTTADLLAVSSAHRTAVITAGAALQAAAANPADGTTLANAAQSLVAAVAATASDPADAVRLIGLLAQFAPAQVSTPGPFGAAMQATQDASSALFRRAALAQLAITLTSYQPASQNDADSVLTQTAALFDAEITVAGDAGDDTSYQALRALRETVITDLTKRGADLSVIASFSFSGPLPSLALATRIYRDASREPQLVQQINPRHPAFCPMAFQALAI